jgi:fructose-1,6-bisphosphatase/sedoheptulose 1,7-bisphosphatase-like protein
MGGVRHPGTIEAIPCRVKCGYSVREIRAAKVAARVWIDRTGACMIAGTGRDRLSRSGTDVLRGIVVCHRQLGVDGLIGIGAAAQPVLHAGATRATLRRRRCQYRPSTVGA